MLVTTNRRAIEPAQDLFSGLSRLNRIMDEALGSWNGVPMTFAVPAAADAEYRSAILVQEGKGGRIIAASRI